MSDLFDYRPNTIRFDGDPGTPLAGLWIDVVQVTTWPKYVAMLEARIWADIHDLIAPHVIGWNLTGEVIHETVVPAVMDGELEIAPERTRKTFTKEQLPAPCDAGEDVFQMVPAPVKEWIRAKVIGSMGHRDADPKAESSPSETLPDGEPNATPSEPISVTSRTGRSSSSRRSAAT